MQVDEFKTMLRDIIQTEITIIIRNIMKNPHSEILLRKEAAAYLKCDLSTLWEWTKAGKLTAYGIGSRRVYYLRSEIPAILIRKN